jgi:hypothetical protein
MELVRSASGSGSADDWREGRRAFQSAVFPGEEQAPREIPLDDGGTILLVSAAALEQLNGRLGERGMAPLHMGRFRPNFVIGGGVAAHAEDEWLELQLGEVRLRVERACTRCSTVMVDQRNGTPVRSAARRAGSSAPRAVVVRVRALRAPVSCLGPGPFIACVRATAAQGAVNWLSKVLAKYRLSRADLAYGGLTSKEPSLVSVSAHHHHLARVS